MEILLFPAQSLKSKINLQLTQEGKAGNAIAKFAYNPGGAVSAI